MEGDGLSRLRTVAAGLGLIAALGMAGAVEAQVSNIASATLSGTMAEALTVTVTGGSTVNFAMVAGAAADGDVAVSIQTQWVLGLLPTLVSLYAYFDVPAQALTDGSGNDIPSTAVRGQVLTGAPLLYTAFTQTNSFGPAGGSLKLFDEIILILNKSKTRNDDLNLRIDLSSLTSLPAGTYTGTLRIRAEAL
jgi:hypothetical protein